MGGNGGLISGKNDGRNKSYVFRLIICIYGQISYVYTDTSPYRYDLYTQVGETVEETVGESAEETNGSNCGRVLYYAMTHSTVLPF